MADLYGAVNFLFILLILFTVNRIEDSVDKFVKSSTSSKDEDNKNSTIKSNKNIIRRFIKWINT